MRNKIRKKLNKKFVKSLKNMDEERMVEVSIIRYYLFSKNIISIEMIKDMFDNFSIENSHATRHYYRIKDKLEKYKIFD